jgi:hypothetical protein
MRDQDVIDALGGIIPLEGIIDAGDLTEDKYHVLFPLYEDVMPYGTLKARTGDPYEFIMQELTDLSTRIVKKETEPIKRKHKYDFS